jgi:hypothetical protein
MATHPLLLLMFEGPYHNDLMQQAKVLLDEGKYPLAVVVAQTACEVLGEQMMTLLTESVDERVRRWIRDRLPRTVDLDDERVRVLYTALSGDPIESQPFWSDYKEHVKLRHRVVHRGVRVTEADARRSYGAAQRLLEHLVAVLAKLTTDSDDSSPPASSARGSVRS